MARVLYERSAGGVLVIPVGPELIVPLIELRGGAVLALPKGHVEPGETPADAARRETREETGLLGNVLEPLGEISYWFWSRAGQSRVRKRVEFFLLLYRAGSPAHHNGEVDGVRMVPVRGAEALLAYPGERAIMRAAQERVRALFGDRPPTSAATSEPDLALTTAPGV